MPLPTDHQLAGVERAADLQSPQAKALFRVLRDEDVPDAAQEQAAEAIDLTRLDYAGQPRMPWMPLHELVGPVLPDALWIIGAQTGNGKTTFLMNWLQGMATSSRARAYVLPLENPPAKMRLLWAALSLKLDPALVLENRWTELESGAEKQIQAHVAEQVEDGKHIVFSEVEYLSPEHLQRAFEDAKDRQCSVILIDHLHRLAESSYQAMAMVAKLLSKYIRQFRIPVVCTAQFNTGFERNPFQGFREPSLTDIYMGQVISHESHVVLGLYRPLMDMTKEEQRKVKERKEKAWHYAKPGAVGVHVMKHRVRGIRAEGQTVELRYEGGRIV